MFLRWVKWQTVHGGRLERQQCERALQERYRSSQPNTRFKFFNRWCFNSGGNRGVHDLKTKWTIGNADGDRMGLVNRKACFRHGWTCSLTLRCNGKGKWSRRDVGPIQIGEWLGACIEVKMVEANHKLESKVSCRVSIFESGCKKGRIIDTFATGWAILPSEPKCCRLETLRNDQGSMI
jgi:hypothetical protein